MVANGCKCVASRLRSCRGLSPSPAEAAGRPRDGQTSLPPPPQRDHRSEPRDAAGWPGGVASGLNEILLKIILYYKTFKHTKVATGSESHIKTNKYLKILTKKAANLNSVLYQRCCLGVCECTFCAFSQVLTRENRVFW